MTLETAVIASFIYITSVWVKVWVLELRVKELEKKMMTEEDKT